MLYDVTAFSIDSTTGQPTSEPRVETIDTETNQLFWQLNGPWEIEDAYLRFWNRLNGSWEHDFPNGKDKVVVVKVEQH